MPKKKKDPTAVQANSLVSARYRLTLGEQFLVLVMISKIDYQDSAFQGYEISIKELANTLQLNEDCTYREANNITDKLLKRILRISKPDGSLLKCNWIASAEHFSGRVVLTPAPALRPYLLELREKFTKVPLNQVKGLRSQYSVRIYMLLRQYVGLGSFELAVDEFREILSLEKQYPRFSEMRRWVINPAQKELKSKADLSFKLETEKTGRSISILKFIIIKNKKQSAKTIKSNLDIGKASARTVKSAVKSGPEPQEKPISRIPAPRYWKQYREYAKKKNDKLLLILIDSGEWDVPVLRCEYKIWERDVYLK
jgi:plasmid replication initiation protein